MSKENPTLEEMSGETKSSPRLVLNDLQFSGKTNNFSLVLKKDGLQQDGEKKKFKKIDLGNTATVVFLRIRRKLRQFRKGEKPLTTNEHNTKYDMLTLFGDNNIVKGTNDELREKYPLLKTNQIVYCLLLRDGQEPELVRMNVKGASLGSEKKAKGVHDFYSYISSFKSGGADEHFYEYKTNLFGVEEENDLGTYYAMTYQQGDSVKEDPQMMATITQNMKQVFDFINQTDAYYKTKNVEELNKEKKQEQNDDIDTIEYPEDDIDPEDIPF